MSSVTTSRGVSSACHCFDIELFHLTEANPLVREQSTWLKTQNNREAVCQLVPLVLIDCLLLNWDRTVELVRLAT